MRTNTNNNHPSGALPLSGVLVLDFTNWLPGPLATLMMLESGAEVVKVESLEGDPLRAWPPVWGRDSALFGMLNRGKKSIRLDLKDTTQLEHLLPLVKRADVIVENFRPGVMERLGLGFKAVHALNPRAIYCSITGFGQTGGHSGEPAHDLTLQAMTGLLALSSGTAKHPSMPPFSASDIAGGTWPAFANVLLALMQREKTGEGMHIDISMSENLFMSMGWAIAEGLAGDKWPKGGKAAITGANPRYRLYAARDRRLIAVAALEDKFWKILCDLTGLPGDLRDDAKAPKKTIAKLTEIFAGKDSAHWKKAFEQKPCCCAVAATLEEALRDTHFHERGVFDHTLENEKGDTLPATPLAIAPELRQRPRAATAPAPGAHNDSLLK